MFWPWPGRCCCGLGWWWLLNLDQRRVRVYTVLDQPPPVVTQTRVLGPGQAGSSVSQQQRGWTLGLPHRITQECLHTLDTHHHHHYQYPVFTQHRPVPTLQQPRALHTTARPVIWFQVSLHCWYVSKWFYLSLSIVTVYSRVLSSGSAV